MSDTEVGGNVALSGGGLSLRGGATFVARCNITSNRAASVLGKGGGVYVTGGTASFDSSQIENNLAQQVGGGAWVEKEAADAATAVLILTMCRVLSNRALGGGGGGLGISNGATGTVLGGEISRNTASDTGGGIYVVGSFLSIQGPTSLGDNSARGSKGGGIAAGRSTVNLLAVNFIRNAARMVGGGCSLFDSPSVLDRCMFSDNSASAGRSLSVEGTAVKAALADLGCSETVKVLRTTFELSSAKGGRESSLSLTGLIHLRNSTFKGPNILQLVEPLIFDVARCEFGPEVQLVASSEGAARRIIRARNSVFLPTVQPSETVLDTTVKCAKDTGVDAGCDVKALCSNAVFGVTCGCSESSDLFDISEFSDGSTCTESSRATIFERTRNVQVDCRIARRTVSCMRGVLSVMYEVCCLLCTRCVVCYVPADGVEVARNRDLIRHCRHGHTSH